MDSKEAHWNVFDVRGLLAARTIVLLLSIGGAAIASFATKDWNSSQFYICALIYSVILALTAVSAISAKYIGYKWSFLWAQFSVDIFLASFLIYISGGPISPLLFIYLPVVMGASVLASRRSGLFVSLMALAVYGAMIFALMNGTLPLFDDQLPIRIPASGFTLQFLSLGSGMTLIAVASSFLAKTSKNSHSRALQSEEKLKLFEDQQHQMINELPDAVFITDIFSNIKTFNKAAKELFNIDSDLIVGISLREVLKPMLSESALSTISRGKDGEILLGDKSGSERKFSLAVRKTGDGLSDRLYIFQDVTQLRSVEEQLALQERMAKLLSHDPIDSGDPAIVRTKVKDFVGESPVMQQVFKLIARIAPSNATVLINGESGTGKELVARAIHLGGPRSIKPFVPVNCGAIPENLIESELFGHKRGSFTGAHSDHDGLFKQADGGTLFLDEIGELPIQMQSKLLRAIQDKQIRPVGGERSLEINVRIIAATNRSLKKEVESKTFREDLYYRLNVINVVLPPLRERREDIPLLINSILKGIVKNEEVPVVTPAVMQALVSYTYPGNVRELENLLERACVMGGSAILPEHLPEFLNTAHQFAPKLTPNKETKIFTLDDIALPTNLDALLEEIECSYLKAALEKTDGAKKKAAQLLGINFRSFRYRLSKFELAGDGAED